MNDKSNRVSTEVSVAESQRRDLDGARVGCAERTTALGSSRLQCVKASGENNVTIHLDGTVQNDQKNSVDRVRATSMTIGCHSRPLGVVDEVGTRCANREASSGINASDGIPSEKAKGTKSKMNRLINAGRNMLLLVAKRLMRRIGKGDDPP